MSFLYFDNIEIQMYRTHIANSLSLIYYFLLFSVPSSLKRASIFFSKDAYIYTNLRSLLPFLSFSFLSSISVKQFLFFFHIIMSTCTISNITRFFSLFFIMNFFSLISSLPVFLSSSQFLPTFFAWLSFIDILPDIFFQDSLPCS